MNIREQNRIYFEIKSSNDDAIEKCKVGGSEYNIRIDISIALQARSYDEMKSKMHSKTAFWSVAKPNLAKKIFTPYLQKLI